jgi:iron complex outermembrane receptor protein
VLLDQDLRNKPGSTASVAAEGNDPSNRWLLRSSLDLAPAQKLDVLVRRVGRLPNPEVPAYTAVDLRYGWAVTSELDLSLTAQNLLDPEHPEFGAAATRSEIPRSVFLKLQWSL